MKKTTVFAAVLVLFASFAPFAEAQTYVYPINTTGYGYSAPSYNSSCLSLTRYLSLGSSDGYTGGEVTMLQQFFNRTGYLSGVSGYFDNGTVGAVINWQRDHGISATGTVGPVTRASLNQQSCGSSYLPAPIPAPIPVPVPVPPSNNNCYWQNGNYTCNNCVGSYYGNNNCNYNCNANYNSNCYGATLNSMNASYNNGAVTITLRGYGFSTQNNTVHFNGTTFTNVSSYDGHALSFTIPYGFYSGNYDFYVVTGNGAMTNTLSAALNSSGWNNNNSSGTVSLSSINGPTSVSTGSSNTWNVSVSNSTNSYYGNQLVTLNVDWGDGTTISTQQASIYGSQNLSFSHVYYNNGTYTMRMTAQGSNGAYYYQNLTVFVTGNNNGGYYGTPYISYLSPTSGSVGRVITIQGSGFSSYGNTVHFGNGGAMNLSSYNNGSQISYTIPSRISGCDLTGNSSYCAQWLSYVTSGSYPIYVTNSNGQSSNTTYFQVY
jgi:peptidoglycan hydrolase-like protein with peptidoglycan-binding domain